MARAGHGRRESGSERAMLVGCGSAGDGGAAGEAAPLAPTKAREQGEFGFEG